MDSYISEVLEISCEKFEHVSLGNIARNESEEDILHMLEMVMYAVVNCPQKETYVHRIMELDVECQTQLMFFIQRVLGKDEENPLNDSDSELPEREVRMLRKEKRRLTYQIQKMSHELESIGNVKEKLVNEKEELKLQNTDLQSELSRRSPKTQPSEVSRELETQLSQKELQLDQLKNNFNEIKKQYETEIASLRDELDVANSKLHNLYASEKTLKQYKKRLEQMGSMKAKMQELQKNNEQMQEKVHKQSLELGEVVKLRQQLQQTKESLAKEREKSGSLHFQIENKDKQLRKLGKNNAELEEKLKFSENRIQDFQNELDKKGYESPNTSEDSFFCNKGFDEEIQKEMSRKSSMRALRPATPSSLDQLETTLKEKHQLQELLQHKKEKYEELKERNAMLYDEMRQKLIEAQNRSADLSKKNQALTSQIEALSKDLSDTRNQSFKYQQVVYELDEVKSSKEQLLTEIKKLYQDKDDIYKKYIHSREECASLQNQLHDKALSDRDTQLEAKLLKDQIKALTQKESLSNSELNKLRKRNRETSEDYHVKFNDLEKECVSLKCENQGLKLKLKEKDSRMQEIIKDKNYTISILKDQHKEVLEKLKQENDWKIQQMVGQTEEALNKLQKEREELAAKLQFEKQNTFAEWKKTFGSESNVNNEEVNSLKKELKKKDKDIEILMRANDDIKKAWKEAARTLKAVWKEIGNETKRMEYATKHRFN